MLTKKTVRKDRYSFLRESIFPLILILISLFVYHIWIFTSGILTSTDWWFYFNETMNSIMIYFFSVWFVDYTPGRVLLELGQAPVDMWFGIFSTYFHFNYALAERILYFWPVVIFTPLWSYIFLKKIFKNPIACFIGVLVYSFNTYFIILQTADMTLMAADAFIPLIFLLYKLTLDKFTLFLALLTGLILFICSSYEPRVFYMVAWMLFFYAVYRFILFGKKSIKTIGVFSWYAFLPFLTILLLSTFWILALINTGSLETNSLFSRELFGNEFFNVLNALTLFHPYWTGTKPAVFILQTIPFYFWLIPLFAFAGLLLNRKNTTVLFFGFISILGILLSKQIGPPFTNIYLFLYNHLPGFNAFREASKFYTYIAFGYSVLIASFVDWLWENFRNTKWQIVTKYILTLIIGAIFLWNTKPIVTGEIANLFVIRKVPSDYLIVKNFIVNQNTYFRTLWTPTSSRWSIYTAEHPKVDTATLIYAQWNPYIKKQQQIKNITDTELMLDVLKKKYSNNLLDKSSIKYVILPMPDGPQDDPIFSLYAKNRQYDINELNKIGYLKEINIGTKYIKVYENKNYRSHFYITDQRESLNQNIYYKNISSQFLGPTKYKLTLTNLSKPIYLTFTDSFHPDWKLRIGNFNWYTVLTNTNYFVNDKNHFQNDTMSNTFYLNPQVLCSQFSCRKKKNGTYTIDITVYFKPQSYLYLGEIISVLFFVGIFSYLVYILFKNKLWEK